MMMRIWCLLSGVLLVVFMLNVDFTAVNLALETMSKEFGADVPTIQWIMSAYVLAWCACVIAAGRLADLCGRRRLLLAGTLVFVFASLLTGVAHSISVAILSRALQGFGGALFIPSLYAAIYSNFPEGKRGFAIGLLGAVAGLGQAVGPSLGGLLIHWISWRWIFFINIPLGFIAILIFLLTLDKEKPPENLSDFDSVGVLVSASALVSFMLALSKGPEWGFLSPLTLSCFVLSFLSAIVFVWQQGRVKLPLIPVELFKNKKYLICTIIYFFFSYNFVTSMFGLGLYLQNTLGYSAFDAGLIFLSYTLMFGLLSAFGGKLADHVPGQAIVVIGLVLMLLGLLGAACLNEHSSLLQVCFTLFIMGVALGLTFPVLNTLMMGALSEKDLSVGSGVFTMVSLAGDSISLVMNAVLLVLFGRYYLLGQLSKEHINLTAQQQETLLSTISSAHYDDRILHLFPVNSQHLLDLLHHAFVYGLSRAILFSASLIVISLWVARRFYSSAKSEHA